MMSSPGTPYRLADMCIELTVYSEEQADDPPPKTILATTLIDQRFDLVKTEHLRCYHLSFQKFLSVWNPDLDSATHTLEVELPAQKPDLSPLYMRICDEATFQNAMGASQLNTDQSKQESRIIKVLLRNADNQLTQNGRMLAASHVTNTTSGTTKDMDMRRLSDKGSGIDDNPMSLAPRC